MEHSTEKGLPREAVVLRRYAGYLKDSPIGNRCLDCGHVRHNDLGYCQIGECSCEYHNSIEGLGRLIERDLDALLTRVTPPTDTRNADGAGS